jgi:hypothetical protein
VRGAPAAADSGYKNPQNGVELASCLMGWPTAAAQATHAARLVIMKSHLSTIVEQPSLSWGHRAPANTVTSSRHEDGAASWPGSRAWAARRCSCPRQRQAPAHTACSPCSRSRGCSVAPRHTAAAPLLRRACQGLLQRLQLVEGRPRVLLRGSHAPLRARGRFRSVGRLGAEARPWGWFAAAGAS